MELFDFTKTEFGPNSLNLFSLVMVLISVIYPLSTGFVFKSIIKYDLKKKKINFDHYRFVLNMWNTWIHKHSLPSKQPINFQEMYLLVPIQF